jgi:hypothetical protein
MVRAGDLEAGAGSRVRGRVEGGRGRDGHAGRERRPCVWKIFTFLTTPS